MLVQRLASLQAVVELAEELVEQVPFEGPRIFRTAF